MAQLAKRQSASGLTRLEEIAQSEAVSANFLVQILNDLRRAGLVESRRGQSGGYFLARPAAEITLRQVVEAVEPGLLQVSVTGDGESGARVKQAWQRVSEGTRRVMDEQTLESLLQEGGAPMFYI